MHGTAERPRLVVFRSNRGIEAQLVDDDAGRTLASASHLALAKSFKGDKTEQAEEVGKRSPRRRRRPAWTLACSTAAATCTTDASRRSPTARAREDSSSDGRSITPETRELKERVVEINRVAKVVKGGRRFSFTALVVVGDEVDRVGVGYGKAREVPLAITKAVEDAKKNIFTVPKHGSTITHEVLGRFDAAGCMLRPASEGTGVIAGGGVRAVLELGGVRNVLAKSLGTTNPINMAKATVAALQELRRPEDVAQDPRQAISEVLPLPTIKAAPEVRTSRGRASTAPPTTLAAEEEPEAPLEEAALAAAVVEEQPAVIEEAPRRAGDACRRAGRRGRA